MQKWAIKNKKKHYLILLFVMWLLVSCNKKSNALTYKLLPDDTYQIVGYNKVELPENLIIPSTYKNKIIFENGSKSNKLYPSYRVKPR